MNYKQHEPRTAKHEEARNSLPDELKPIFDDFVADYKFAAATIRYGSPFVSCSVLADTVRAGWHLGTEVTGAVPSTRPPSE